MDSEIKQEFEKSTSKNKEERYESYLRILEATDQQVDWAYEVWDQLVEDLMHKDNHQRSRAAQYLANLAKSDPEQRMLEDFPKIWAMKLMKDRFQNGTEEKNFTLIRSDIIQNMKHLYDHLGDEKIKQTAIDLIGTVDDKKYKKKYMNIWKKH